MPHLWRALRALAVLTFLPTVAWCQDTAIALRGTVVTPDGPIADGWVLVRSGLIKSVTSERPEVVGATYVETKGIIYPGFVDLHNHPAYAAFSHWVPVVQFRNRYVWRALPSYMSRVGIPGRVLQADDQGFCDLNEYAELRAVVGGTTAIHGTSAQKQASPEVPSCIRGLIRHLDWFSGLGGNEIGNEKVIGVLDISSVDAVRAGDLNKQISAGQIHRLLIHLAEGVPTDQDSRNEFTKFENLHLLGPKTAIIHGTALGPGEFKKMASNGTALIWSPRSNFALYGTTTDVKAARDLGVTIALAPDWSVTGSSNMLAEIQYASSLNQPPTSQIFTAQELFEMATIIPARLAGLDEKIGSLHAGAVADLFVLRGDPADPFRALVQSRPQDIQLVMVGGLAVYGADQLLVPIVNASTAPVRVERIDACGEGRVLALPRSLASVDPLEKVRARLEKQLLTFNDPLAPIFDCP